MKDKRFVYYNETGTNTHHYFATYKEAKAYIENNNIGGGRIAYLLAYSSNDLIELGGCKEEKATHKAG